MATKNLKLDTDEAAALNEVIEQQDARIKELEAQLTKKAPDAPVAATVEIDGDTYLVHHGVQYPDGSILRTYSVEQIAAAQTLLLELYAAGSTAVSKL